MMRRISLALLLVGQATGAIAQQKPMVAAQVDYIAGANLYLDVGSDSGVVTGDTLTVYAVTDSASSLGRLLVLSSVKDRAVVGFAGRPFPVTRGARWLIRIAAGVKAAGPAAGEPPGPDTADASANQASATPGPTGDARAAGQAPAAETGGGRATLSPQLDGRLSLDLDAVRTRSRWGGAASGGTLSQAGPTLHLWAVVSHLPANLRLNLSMLATHRYASGFTFDQPTSVRFYQASLIEDFSAIPLEIELGRFYGPYGTFSGFWDGARLRVGGPSLGVGAALGYEPQLGNEGLSSQVSKVSAFLDAHHRAGPARYDAVVSAHRRWVSGDSVAYDFVGLDQSLSLARLRLYQRVRIDDEPNAGHWLLTQLQLGSSLEVGGGFGVHADYAQERPPPLWTATDVFGVNRERLGGGVSWAGAAGGVNLDVSSIHTAGWGTGVSYASSMTVTRVPGVGMGGYASIAYWVQGSMRTLYAAPGLDRTFGRVRLSAGYHLYRVQPGGSLTRMDGVEAAITLPAAPSLWATLQASQDWGAQLTTTRVYLRLWTSF